LSTQPTYFVVVFWGERFVRYFAELTLPSLLAPNNLPAFGDRQHARFLICTTAPDWALLQRLPSFVRLKALMGVELLEMLAPQPGQTKMWLMSQAHKRLVTRAFRDRARCFYLTPDLLFADGFVSSMQSRQRKGAKLILMPSVRFEYEGIREELAGRGMLEGERIVLAPRECVALGLRNIHPETLACDWESERFTDFPVHVYWRADQGIVLHTVSWAPMFMDFAVVPKHDDSVFHEWTIDGDYLYRNFGRFSIGRDVHLVQDSDEAVFLGFTPRNEAGGPGSPGYLGGMQLTRRWQQRQGLNWERCSKLNAVYRSAIVDPLKRKIFMRPAQLHASDLDPSWAEIEATALSQLRSHLLMNHPLRWFSYFLAWQYLWRPHTRSSTIALMWSGDIDFWELYVWPHVRLIRYLTIRSVLGHLPRPLLRALLRLCTRQLAHRVVRIMYRYQPLSPKWVVMLKPVVRATLAALPRSLALTFLRLVPTRFRAPVRRCLPAAAGPADRTSSATTPR
jgi:hypothetical protein